MKQIDSNISLKDFLEVIKDEKLVKIYLTDHVSEYLSMVETTAAKKGICLTASGALRLIIVKGTKPAVDWLESSLTTISQPSHSQESVQENSGPVPPTPSPDASSDKGDPS